MKPDLVRTLREPWLSSCNEDQLPGFAERIGWELVARDPVEGFDLELFAAVELRPRG